ncbi:MAG: S24/S26 family peptidase [Clostridia bacterium]|nr:S24/S26 family peptidase [Clostridia bacterium]
MFSADSSKLNIEAALCEKGEIMTSTSGVSMYPMLRHRKDMVVIKKLDAPLKKHDVAVYRMPSGKLLIHRVLKVTKDCYIIRGDNRLNKEYIKPEWIIGVLKEFYRNGKKYDCETNRLYKAYILFMRLTFPLRVMWHKGRKLLVKIKHLIFGKPKAK